MIKTTTLAQIAITFVLLYHASHIVGQTPPENSTSPETAITESANTEEQGNTIEEGSLETGPRKSIDIEKNALALISEEVEMADIVWLEYNGERFMSLWKDDATGTPFGAVLILHGEGQSAAWPHSIDAIRNNLGLFGWAALAISLPPAQKTKIPKRPKKAPQPKAEETTLDETGDPDDLTDPKTQEQLAEIAEIKDQEKQAESTEEDTNTATMISPEDISSGRITSAIAYLNDNGHYNIVMVAQGSGVIRAAKYIDEQTNTNAMYKGKQAKIKRPFRAFILIEPKNYLPMISEKKLTSFLNDHGLPILDIYASEHHLDRNERHERKMHARSKNFLNYFQVKVLPDRKSVV